MHREHGLGPHLPDQRGGGLGRHDPDHAGSAVHRPAGGEQRGSGETVAAREQAEDTPAVLI